MSQRIPIKIEGRAERIAYLDPETAAQVVADGLGSYLDEGRGKDAIETTAVGPPENAATRTGRSTPRQAR